MNKSVKHAFITFAIISVLGIGSLFALRAIAKAMWHMPEWTTIQDYPARHAFWQTDSYRKKGVGHFPDPTLGLPNGAAFYERQGMMQGGPGMQLYVPGTPARVAAERTRISALGLDPTTEYLRWAQSDLVNFGSTTQADSTSAQLILREFSSRPGNFSMFWSDSITGEMLYVASFD
ncbi:MAG: hypothetical protein ACI89L_001080 [Phycisphaerales bacterium]|jgi:hypothetical protein